MHRAIRVLAGLLALSVALAIPVMAQASPTPTSPAEGTSTDWAPTFAWTLGDGETTGNFFLSDEKKTNGGVLSGNSIVNKSLAGTSFTFGDDLVAGAYWWQVTSKTAEGAEFLSPITMFTVKPTISTTPLVVTKTRVWPQDPNSKHASDIATKLACNVNHMVMTHWKASKGSKVVYTHDELWPCGTRKHPSAIRAVYWSAKAKPGTLLNVDLTVRDGAAVSTEHSTFRTH